MIERIRINTQPSIDKTKLGRLETTSSVPPTSCAASNLTFLTGMSPVGDARARTMSVNPAVLPVSSFRESFTVLSLLTVYRV